MRIRLARGVCVWRDLHLNLRALSLATLVTVVLVLGWLQYRWIDEVSQAQEARAKSRLREIVRLISDALDTEVTRAGVVFTLPPAPDSAMYEALEERWATWNHDAPWPQIVSGVSLVESTGAGWQVSSFGDSGTFDLRSIPAAEIISEPPPPGAHTAGASHTEVGIPDHFISGQPYLVMPIPTILESTGALRMNYVVIRYNLSYLANSVFPRLLEKYSTAEDRLDFRFQIVPKGPIAPGTITVADQFHYRRDCLMPNGGGRAGLSVSRLGGKTHGAVSEFGSFVGESTPLSSMFHAVGQCQIPASPSNPGLMQLSVSRQGGLADIYTGFRRRNEILSALVLVVLLVALAALVVSTERARRLARLQTVVAAGISHELRTPLASLTVAADHLKNGHVRNVEQARRYGEIIEAQSRRLRHVVDQALAVTSLSQSNELRCPRAVSVPEIIRAGIDTLAPGVSEAAIEIEWHTAPDVPMIMADPELVLRCVTNLIENSIKYAGSGGWIQISARGGRHAGRSLVEVIVEDRGPGIQDEETTAVFEPFYRGSSARQSRQPGSGLGLAIVKSAVEAHGGWIQLERAVPQGCRFRLFFPAADHDHSVDSAESEAPQCRPL
jgi:signal transduction histidine kinase